MTATVDTEGRGREVSLGMSFVARSAAWC